MNINLARIQRIIAMINDAKEDSDFPKGNNVDCLSIYLDAGGNLANLPDNWNKFANFKLVLINQINNKRTITRELKHQFNAKEITWGLARFIPINELCGYNNGYIMNDTCIIEVEILVDKLKHKNLVDQVDNKINDKPIEHIDNIIPNKMLTKLGELVDFRGLGKIEQDFVSLLEEVCLQHPSLINIQKNRTQRFVEWAFTALGRVLHFLKTKKVKDMNDNACNHLQILWEELETFKFDLSWLEPHVKSALSMKNYTERTIQLNKLKENVSALEKEVKMLKAKIMEAKVNLEIAKRDLAKTIEGFEECSLEAELGY
ncbi:hypothetical protein VNO78_21192 [Psophocarpus tetragonolobus]|uniref:MATH domain-containing protein n=1 Tax=Psophocarpus tetragonolobus TaxID=3891 RepID=A0AAN9SBM7_PSOTE